MLHVCRKDIRMLFCVHIAWSFPFLPSFLHESWYRRGCRLPPGCMRCDKKFQNYRYKIQKQYLIKFLSTSHSKQSSCAVINYSQRCFCFSFNALWLSLTYLKHVQYPLRLMPGLLPSWNNKWTCKSGCKNEHCDLIISCSKGTHEGCRLILTVDINYV